MTQIDWYSFAWGAAAMLALLVLLDILGGLRQ